MQFSDNGLRFTAAWETFQPRPYFATREEQARGLYTWGYGHTGKRPPDVITRDQALALLRQDVQKVVYTLNKYVHPSINQAQFDALVDLGINAGTGPLVPDDTANDLDDAIRDGNWARVRAILPTFKYQAGKVLPGLVRRATGRVALFDGDQWDVAEQKGRKAC